MRNGQSGFGSGEWRYERKLRVPAGQVERLEHLIRLHPARFREVYDFRYVNNVYLDTMLRTCLFDHVSGVSRRRKVRVRWYGPLEGQRGGQSGGQLERPQLEIKAKCGWVMTKPVYALRDATLDEVLSAAGLRRLVAESACPESIAEMTALLQPALVNRYRRRYFRTLDGAVRLTVDTEMAFFLPEPAACSARPGRTDPSVVVELKYDRADIAAGAAVSAYLPLPLSKNSKFVNGMQLLYGP